MCASFPFAFEGGMWDLIILVPDHFLSPVLIYVYLYLVSINSHNCSRTPTFLESKKANDT